MAKARIVGKLDASQNLSTSPFTVSGLKGDTFDYTFMAFVDSGTGTGGALNITLNSDTGTNYNRYRMAGYTSTAVANVVTGETGVLLGDFARWSSSRNGLAMGSLTGESGSNRKLSAFYCDGFPLIQQADHYWTNTADEVDEITFTGSVSASYTWHIVVWEVPKASNLDGWEYVNKLDWSSETAEKSFSSLDGDTDIQYMIDWDGDQQVLIEINNDATSNYVTQRLRNSSGTISATNSTVSNIPMLPQGSIIINAESGADRLCFNSSSQTSSFHQQQRAIWWQNTASNLVSLDCTPSASATGTCKLYRKKLKTSMQTDLYNLPFRTIEEYDVSGDFSAGQTTTISGDDYLMLKVEWLGNNTTTDNTIRVQFNSDTGSNYTRQYLRGRSSTVSAGTSTITSQSLGLNKDAVQTYAFMYIYPKSGEYRPSLSYNAGEELEQWFYGWWWLNSADEITAIDISGANTDSLTGKIRISAIYA